MISVRRYNIGDRDQVEKICLENAGCANAPEDLKTFTLLTRCWYYIEQERENCFVAVDDDGKVVGYVLSSENYNNYERTYTEKYIPKAAAISAKCYVDAKFDMLKHAMYRRYYPAHLYIDVSLDHQNVGVGALLLQTLKAHLKRKFVQGVLAVAEAGNDDLVRFFEANGFQTILETRYGKTMVFEFDE